MEDQECDAVQLFKKKPKVGERVPPPVEDTPRGFEQQIIRRLKGRWIDRNIAAPKILNSKWFKKLQTRRLEIMSQLPPSLREKVMVQLEIVTALKLLREAIAKRRKQREWERRRSLKRKQIESRIVELALKMESSMEQKKLRELRGKADLRHITKAKSLFPSREQQRRFRMR